MFTARGSGLGFCHMRSVVEVQGCFSSYFTTLGSDFATEAFRVPGQEEIMALS